jgi:hypothetical protein
VRLRARSFLDLLVKRVDQFSPQQRRPACRHRSFPAESCRSAPHDEFRLQLTHKGAAL